MTRLTKHAACVGEGKNLYKISIATSKGRKVGGFKCRYEDNINLDIREKCYVG
jgi:hypothetical protein